MDSKDEKQRQNEEISIMKSASTESWEFVSSVTTKKYAGDNDQCSSESPITSSDPVNTNNVSKPCFIDASSLLDDSEICMEPPILPQSGCFGPKPSNQTNNIRDQFSAEGSICDELMIFQCDEPQPASLKLSFEQQETERRKGQKIFDSSIKHFSGQKIPMDNDGGTGTYFNDDKPHSAASSFTTVDDQMLLYTLPTDTPFNSIVQLDYTRFTMDRLPTQQHENDATGHEEYVAESYGTPTKIRGEFVSSRKSYDESIPIISGGSSIEDHYTPKCSSPQVKRKTENCPIVSGGCTNVFANVADESTTRSSRLSSSSSSNTSWTINFNKNESQIKPKMVAATSVDSAKSNNCGFFVDLGNSKVTEPKNVLKQPPKSTIHDDLLRKSTGFFIDFSSDVKAENTTSPKKVSKVDDVEPQEKKNIFSMFVDISGQATEVLSSSFSKRKEVTSNVVIEKQILDEKVDTKDDAESEIVKLRKAEMSVLHRNFDIASKQRHSWNETEQQQQTQRFEDKLIHKRSISVSSENSEAGPSSNPSMSLLESKIPFLSSKTSSMNIDSSVPSPMDDFSSKSLSSNYSNNSVTNSNSSNCGGDADEQKQQRKRRKDAKINETFDKSSVGSITDGILSSHDDNSSSSPISTTDTEDVTFQNNIDIPKIEVGANPLHLKKNDVIQRNNSTMEAILEQQHASAKESSHTMETLQATIEKQKQLLETVNENIDENQKNKSFYVKLSDMDKPILNDNEPSTVISDIFSNSMSSALRSNRNRGSNSAGHKQRQSWNFMSSSTGAGNPINNLASSFENSKSLSRLFPHLSKAFSNSVPTNMELTSTNTNTSGTTNHNIAFNNSHYLNQSNIIMCDCIESVTTDFSCTSSTSSRSGIEDSADDSSISCRQRLGEDLLKMFLQEIATDVAIEVAGGKKMRAHKCILRSRCQFFAAMLAGNWLNNSGNVITLPPEYSFATVHFALCHIYSGASHPPEGISLMELASLADLLGLEGLKEVTAYALKINYCHNFHKPCSGCIEGICSVLPAALNHGLDELYRKCLKWVCKHYIKVWSTRVFSQLPKDLFNRCRQQIVAHMNSESVINIILDCEQLLSILAPCRWATTVEIVIREIFDDCMNYISEHFSNLIASDSFLSLGHGNGNSWTLTHIENILLRTASTLTAEQACKSYPRANRLNKLLQAKVITMPVAGNDDGDEKKTNNLNLLKGGGLHHEEEMDWSEDFVRLVSAILSAVEQCLIRQCARAMRVTAWQRMDVELRNKIQKLACLTEAAHNTSLDKLSSRSSLSKYNYASSGSSGFSSSQSRNNDLQQVRLTMLQQQTVQNAKPYQQPLSMLPNTNNYQRSSSATHSQTIHYNNFDIKKSNVQSTASRPLSKTASKANVPTTLVLMNTKNINLKATKKLSNDDNFHNKDNLSDKEENSLASLPAIPSKIKSRYLDPPVRSVKPFTKGQSVAKKPSSLTITKQKTVGDGSSSTVSSPALGSILARKKMNEKTAINTYKRNSDVPVVKKSTKEMSNLSLDSLSSATSRRPRNLNLMKTAPRLPSNDKLDISIDSLVSVSVKSSSKCSQESLLLNQERRRNSNGSLTNTKSKNKENLEKLIKPTKASAEREKLNKMNLLLVRNRNRTSTNVATTSDSSPSSIGNGGSARSSILQRSRSVTKPVATGSKKSFLSQKSREILAKREQKLAEVTTVTKKATNGHKSTTGNNTQAPKNKVIHQYGSQNLKNGKHEEVLQQEVLLETKYLVSAKLERSSTFCKECPDNPDLLEISDC